MEEEEEVVVVVVVVEVLDMVKEGCMEEDMEVVEELVVEVVEAMPDMVEGLEVAPAEEEGTGWVVHMAAVTEEVVVMVVDKVLVMFTITLDVNGFPLDLLRFKNIISKKNIDILIL